MKEFTKQELRTMFDGRPVRAELPYHSLDNNREVQEAIANGVGCISLSGAQTKFSMVIDSFAHRADSRRLCVISIL